MLTMLARPSELRAGYNEELIKAKEAGPRFDDFLYFYRAIVRGVYDADTITVDIDLGLGTWKRGEKIRLMGIDAWELRGSEREQGLIARDWVRERILDKEVIIQSVIDKSGKYGRYLGYIYVPGYPISINEQLVAEGHAEFKVY